MKQLEELWSSTNKLYLTIYHEETGNIIYNNWTGYITSDNVKNGAFAVLRALQKHKSSHILNNNKELLGRWDHTVEWIENEWVPLAIESGLRYFAHVVDDHTFAAASAADLLTRVQGRYTMRIFNEVYEARAWLKTCKLETVNI